MNPQPRYALDTSVSVPLLVKAHDAHDVVSAWAAGRVLGLSGHALVETYSVLTRLPGDSRVDPADAVLLIDDNFPEHFVLSAEATSTSHRELARNGVSGGATYDGLVALAAREHEAVLVTRDARARQTYEALGVKVEIIAVPSVSR
ncbi:type II toxin-antitoxin system VapC family toxin [Subtercola frigoramans]|uniref:Ribonuclease VapC n=1 Tax=Subtercola frigoramans TaxID=120298 RepID=A0ABS2L3N5_9MICO|nr:type II toxin-antitoxin system VapC family toxin [Subtercola frigoramans]MBM7471717.1 putative nucleic acid-binding protein [Subtercola frigoramans]